MERIEAEGDVMERFIGAIPPKSIMEAFSRAAASVKSRVAGSADDSVDGEGGGCVKDHGAINGQIPDKLLGIGEMFPPALSLCGNGGKEAEIEGATDEVVVIGAGGEIGQSDFGGKGGCTGGGEVIPGVKNGDVHDCDLDDDDERKEGPILVEGVI